MSENWIRVADASDVPEDGTLLVNLGAEPVCLYNLGGKIFATHDTCTHGQASLADGFIEGEEIDLRHGLPCSELARLPTSAYRAFTVSSALETRTATSMMSSPVEVLTIQPGCIGFPCSA